MFEPVLSLVGNEEGTFDLFSVTLVPDTSYRGLPPYSGIPEGMMVTPETEPVILPLQRVSDWAMQVANPITQALYEIPLGQGKTQVVAFVVLDGKVLGKGVVSPTEVQKGYHTFGRRPDDPDPGEFPIPLRCYIPGIHRVGTKV